MFTPVSTRIEDILNSPTQFAIPVYQRIYKWRTEEAQELIEDLLNYSATENENLFLGNLIFEQTKEQKTYVVDGQQRLTTLILLLVACRTRARDLGLAPLAATIQQKITFVDSTTAESRGPRLIASDSIRDIFDLITKDSWDGKFPTTIEKKQGKKQVKRQVNTLKPIYTYFLKQVSEFNAAELSKFLRAIYNSYAARIEVDSEVEALNIFERTNARGLDLEISDLLKNYLFSKKVDGIEELWAQILENSKGNILRMLKYFYVSKKGYVLKPQLYKMLKKYGELVGAQPLTKALADFSNFFRLVKSADESMTKIYFDDAEITALSTIPDRYQRVFLAIQGLREFNVVQFCPVAFAAIECLIRNGGKEESSHAKKLAQLFEAFENYHFVNNAVCERVGNDVEQLYADTSEEYAKESSNFFKVTDLLINQLKSKLASEAEFKAKFIEIYYPDQSSLILYIFDRFNRYDVHVGQTPPIYDSTPNLKKRNFNIEHFLAKKFQDESKEKKGGKEKPDSSYIDNIGNLLPMHYRDNSALGSEPPSEKIKLLTGEMEKGVQCSPFLSDFIAEYSTQADTWDKATIQARAEALSIKAYNQIWKIN